MENHARTCVCVRAFVLDAFILCPGIFIAQVVCAYVRDWRWTRGSGSGGGVDVDQVVGG